jgi:hypothetical protein
MFSVEYFILGTLEDVRGIALDIEYHVRAARRHVLWLNMRVSQDAMHIPKGWNTSKG